MRAYRAVLTLAAGLCLAGAAAAQDKSADAIADNVQKLGHAKFAVRDQAARELVRAGEPALKALKAALASRDEEVRTRAAALVGRIEARAQNEALIRAPKLRLKYENRPLDEAVADAARQTGLPFKLDPKVANAKRPVTIDTGEAPYWEAVEKFLAAAGLAENPAAPAAAFDQPNSFTEQGFRQGRIRRNQWHVVPSAPNPAAPGFILVESKSAAPAATANLIRVKALPKDFPGNVATKGSGEVTVTLDVTPAPALSWQGLVGVDVRRAVDDRGVSLDPSLVGRSGANNVILYGEDMGIAVQQLQGNVVIWDAGGPPGGPQPSDPRHVPVSLLVKDSSPKMLKHLDGVITAQVQTPPQALLTVENLLTAATKDEIRGGAYQLQIVERKTSKGGYVQLRFKLVAPAQFDFIDIPVKRGGVARPFIRIDGGYIGGGQPNLSLTGPDGKPVVNHSLTVLEQSFNGENQTFEYLLVLFLGDKKAENSVKMVLTGRKSVFVEIPFALKDVPLP